MARDDRGSAPPDGILKAQISLMGEVTADMARGMLDQLGNIPDGDDPVTLEITTLGGDPEFARRMGLEVDLARERLKPRRLVFLGKTVVYSAGVTLMAAFPRADRFLTAGATLLIHCRQLEKTLELRGPLRASMPQVEALQHELKVGIDLETRNFQRLIEGSKVTMDELLQKALYNWYVPAEEALDLGLIAGIVPPDRTPQHFPRQRRAAVPA